MKDYYEILKVIDTAGMQEIRRAYKSRAMECHPDRNEGDPAATGMMQDVNEAYAVLSDVKKRAEYDELRRNDASSAYDAFRRRYTVEDIFADSDIEHVMNDLLNLFFSGRRTFDVTDEMIDLTQKPSRPGRNFFRDEDGAIWINL